MSPSQFCGSKTIRSDKYLVGVVTGSQELAVALQMTLVKGLVQHLDAKHSGRN